MSAQPGEEGLVIFHSRCRYNWYTLWESVWAGKGGLNRRVILSVQQTFVLANSKIISGSRGVTVRGNELVAWYPVRSLHYMYELTYFRSNAFPSASCMSL